MKCIICDKCKKIIENPKDSRTILCTRPLKRTPGCEPADDRRNDVIWEKELCVDCAVAAEAFVDAAAEGGAEEGGTP